MSPDVPGRGEGMAAAAVSGAVAVPLGAPAGLAESVGDLPAAVVRLVRGEAYLFDAVGSPAARRTVRSSGRAPAASRTGLRRGDGDGGMRGWPAYSLRPATPPETVPGRRTHPSARSPSDGTPVGSTGKGPTAEQRRIRHHSARGPSVGVLPPWSSRRRSWRRSTLGGPPEPPTCSLRTSCT